MPDIVRTLIQFLLPDSLCSFLYSPSLKSLSETGSHKKHVEVYLNFSLPSQCLSERVTLPRELFKGGYLLHWCSPGAKSSVEFCLAWALQVLPLLSHHYGIICVTALLCPETTVFLQSSTASGSDILSTGSYTRLLRTGKLCVMCMSNSELSILWSYSQHLDQLWVIVLLKGNFADKGRERRTNLQV